MDPSPDLTTLVHTRPTHYVLAVPDAVLPAVADELASLLASAGENGPARPFVLHTSGATSVDVLAGCAAKGALTLAFHPLQTFSDPVRGSRRFAGAAVAVTPSAVVDESRCLDEGFALAEGLGARPFHLPDDKKTLYHAAATMASNYLVTLEHCAQTLFVKSGMLQQEAPSLSFPLVQTALDNVRSQGPVTALTGPLSRGDESTISSHLQALAADAPDLLPLYRLMGSHTLDLVRARGEVDPQLIARMARLLAH